MYLSLGRMYGKGAAAPNASTDGTAPELPPTAAAAACGNERSCPGSATRFRLSSLSTPPAAKGK